MSPPDDSPGGVDRRLLAALDPDPVRAEQRYLDLFRQLARFFEWQGARDPEGLAQEVLFRGMRRIVEGVDVYASDPRSYFFGIARNVLKESRKENREQLLDEDGWARQASPRREMQTVENRLALTEALGRLAPGERRLIVRYFRGDDTDRRELANELGITGLALRVRVFRLKERLAALTRPGSSGKSGR